MLSDKSIKTFAYSLICAIALILSLKVTFFINETDSDALLPLTLWTGFKQGGWEWIEHFSYTPDNWLFSVVPFDFTVFYFFKPQPWLVIFSGWVIYALAACLTGLIAFSLKARRAAIYLPLIFLIGGCPFQAGGAASFPVSHNISNLYGLLILFCFSKAVSNKSNYLILLIMILLIVSGLSDPWMIPAYTIPCLLIGIFGWINTKSGQQKCFFAKFSLSLIVVMIFVQTHGFDLFYFLPSQSTKFGDIKTITHNVSVVENAITGMFDISSFLSISQWVSTLLTLSVALGHALIK